MSFGTKYNTRSPAVKRLMREAVELHEPTDQYCAQPLEDNLFEWHFTVRGAPHTEFGGGVYHGRILLPPEYPMKPPSIMLLTPNGRFETGKKICLSMSAHHPETWQPSWSIRTVLLAIIGFMPTKGEGAIGALDYSSQERKILAARSLEWKCDNCGSMNALSLREGFEASDVINQEATELAAQISFKGEKEDEALVKKNVKLHSKIGSLKEMQNSSNTAKVIPDSVEGKSKDNSIGKGKEEKEITHVDAEYRGKERSDNVGSIENRAVDDGDSNVIRKRNTVQKDSKTSDAQSAENDQNLGPNQGTISLVLLWLVVIGLVVLILRRLCMDTISIGKA